MGTYSTLCFAVVLCIPGCGGDGNSGGFGGGTVWPISGTSTPATLSATFGPRIQGSSEEYDFHRGLDMPVPTGTDVHAIAAGEVTVAGDDSYYPEDLVQIGHCNDAQPPATLDACQNPSFTNYQHLSSIDVSRGDRVGRGEYIGRSGASESGFEHLHFEYRDGYSWQRNAVHPLAFLPHNDSSPPLLTLDDVDFTDPAAPIVEVTVTRPPQELDFRRIEAELFSAVDGSSMSRQEYDVDLWNLEYTEDDDPNRKLDNPYFNGITVRPEPFNRTSEHYSVLFRFRELQSTVDPDDVRVVVRAEDVDGGLATAECSPCP